MNNYELQKIVEEISLEFFHKPFIHLATFNSKLRTTGGRYLLRTHNIDINPKHYQKFGFKELEGIIKHELCHYHLHIENKGYQHRDADFKNLSKLVGAPRHCSTVKERKINYIYQCRNCGLQYNRVRVLNTWKYRCGKCQGKLTQAENRKI